LASRSEKTEFSRNYDRCISCNATRAVEIFSLPKRRRKMTLCSKYPPSIIYTPLSALKSRVHGLKALYKEDFVPFRITAASNRAPNDWTMCGNDNYEPDDDIIPPKSSRKRMKIA
ncbi:hypothetical protein AVEN_103497-1, partial [Araneus ventricosus]